MATFGRIAIKWKKNRKVIECWKWLQIWSMDFKSQFHLRCRFHFLRPGSEPVDLSYNSDADGQVAGTLLSCKHTSRRHAVIRRFVAEWPVQHTCTEKQKVIRQGNGKKVTTTAAWQGVDFWPGTILAFCPVIDFPFVSIVESERLLACYPENVIACRTQEKCNCWPTGVGPQANCITWPNAIWSGRWSFSIHLFLFKADWN